MENEGGVKLRTDQSRLTGGKTKNESKYGISESWEDAKKGRGHWRKKGRSKSLEETIARGGKKGHPRGTLGCKGKTKRGTQTQ